MFEFYCGNGDVEKVVFNFFSFLMFVYFVWDYIVEKECCGVLDFVD